MMRRITAALLALIILLSAVPITRASAEEVIYRKGQELRIPVENVILPYDPGKAYQTARGYMWEQLLDKNGGPLMECTLQEHSCSELCFDDNGKRTDACPGAHKHQTNSAKCVMGYVWKVVRDPDQILWFDDPLAPENYALAVCCFEPDGIVPMAGVGLRMFRVIEKEIQEEEGTTEIRKINDSILPVDLEDADSNKNPVTNRNGYYYFTGECKGEIPAGDDTWYLIQMAEEFQEAKDGKPEGKYYNQYRSNSVKWEVDVHTNGDGTFEVKDIRDPNGVSLLSAEEEDEYPKPEQGYDAENKRLVILNQPINVIINIDLMNVPASLEQLDATIEGPNGFEQQIQITKDSGRWHFKSTEDEILKNVTLESGEYTVEAQTGRYPVVYKVNRANEEAVEGKTLYLDKDHQNGFFEIHFASLSNTVKLYAVDGNDEPVTGAVYGLYGTDNQELIETFDAEANSTVVIDINRWKELVTGACTLTIKQIQGPENHDLAENEYTVLITETGDEVDPYTVELLPAKGDKDVRYGEKNEQIGTFVNRKHDLSYQIIPSAVNSETDEPIPGSAVYALTDLETEEDIWGINAGETQDMKAFMAEEYGEDWGTVKFGLTQRTAPDGYERSEDSYTVTVTEGEDGAVSVEMTKDANVLQKIAMFFTGDEIGRDGHNRWLPVFTNKKLEIPHSNTVILRTKDGSIDGSGLKGAKYALFKDGKMLEEVEFDLTSKTELVIDSEDWETVARKLIASDAVTEEEQDALLGGGSLEVLLKQTVKPADREIAAEEYPIEVRRSKAEDNIEDQFFIKLKDAANGTPVQYKKDGVQIATFINKEIKEDVAYVSLTLNPMEDSDYQWNECTEDPQFQNMYYDMGLYWGDSEMPVEVVSLKAGETAAFRSKIPLGQAYTVKPTVAAPDYNIAFTNTANGETANKAYTGEPQVSETVSLTADISYEFLPGSSDIDAEIIVCDAKDTGITLEGAKFVLKDASGAEVPGHTYVTGADGKINITGLEKVPAVYQLEQTEATEGYEPMKGSVSVVVKYSYKPGVDLAGKIIAIQNLVIEAPTHITNSKINETSGMAQIQVTLEDVVLRNKSACKEDREGFSEYNNRTYTFALSWKNEAGKWIEEPDVVELKSGSKRKSGVFAKELPVGTEYKITSADSNRDYNIIFNGTVIQDEYEDYVKQAGVVDIKAKIEYIFEPGSYDKPDLYLKKVYARDTSKTLAGARFTLKDEDAEVLETYKTAKDGIIEIIDQLNDEYPAEYTLKENKAPDDYIKLDGVIHISVYYDYTSYDENGKIIIRQDLVAEASHKDVTKGKDGYYYIKNTHKDDNPKTGDAFNPAAWLGALLVSGAALSYVLITGAKKRGTR